MRRYYEVWSHNFLDEDRQFYGRHLTRRDAELSALEKANETGQATEVVTVTQHHRETKTVRPG